MNPNQSAYLKRIAELETQLADLTGGYDVQCDLLRAEALSRSDHESIVELQEADAMLRILKNDIAEVAGLQPYTAESLRDAYSRATREQWGKIAQHATDAFNHCDGIEKRRSQTSEMFENLRVQMIEEFTQKRSKEQADRAKDR